MRSTVNEKPAEIARAVKGGSKEAPLWLAEHEGTLYATNRYWIVPASRVEPMLSHHNLSAEPGAYNVNGRVSRGDGEPPKVSHIVEPLLSLGAEHELTRVEIAGRPAFVEQGDGYLALFNGADGEPVAVRADWLEWLSRIPRSNYGQPEVYGTGVTVRQEKRDRPLAIFVTRTVQRAGTGQIVTGDDGQNRFVPVAYDEAPPLFLGAIMPVRLG